MNMYSLVYNVTFVVISYQFIHRPMNRYVCDIRYIPKDKTKTVKLTDAMLRAIKTQNLLLTKSYTTSRTKSVCIKIFRQRQVYLCYAGVCLDHMCRPHETIT